MLTAGFNYSSELVEYVSECAADSEIVKAQQSDHSRNVFTGKSFDAKDDSENAFQMESLFHIDGVSDWSDQTGEELRHLVGNAIMEQAFERFEYKKVLSKGVHTIDGKKVEISKDLWDCVPKGKEAPLTIKDGKVLVDLEREYLPGFQAPAVSCKASRWSAMDLEKLFERFENKEEVVKDSSMMERKKRFQKL